MCEPFVPPAVRHRILEGFLLRLSRHPDAEAFVLRGGMFVRHAVGWAARRAQDVDLVCRQLPFEPYAIRRRLVAMLTDRDVDDGVGFVLGSVQIDGVWRGPHTPALCLRVVGAAGPHLGRLSVDVLFGLPLWPDPELGVVQTAGGPARLWMCRPETVIGRKIQVITQLGRFRWRPKDLADLDRLLGVDLQRDLLGQAIEEAFVGCVGGVAEAHRVFGDCRWWRHPHGVGRWRAYAAQQGSATCPEVEAVAASVGASLAPFLTRRGGP